MCKWIKESNRSLHLIGGFILAIFLTMLCSFGASVGLETKDCQNDNTNAGKMPWKWSYKNWDWLDIAATMIGGVVGQAVQSLIIYLIFLK
jgi:hypothetical protein